MHYIKTQTMQQLMVTSIVSQLRLVYYIVNMESMIF